MPSSFIFMFMLLLLYVHVSSCFLPKVLPGSSYSSWSFPCRLGAQHNTLNAALPTWNCHTKDCLHLPHHRGQQSYIKNTVGKPRNHETTVFSYLFLSAILIFAPFVSSDADTFGSSCFLIEADGIISEFLRFWTSGIHSWSWQKRHDIFVMTMTWG